VDRCQLWNDYLELWRSDKFVAMMKPRTDWSRSLPLLIVVFVGGAYVLSGRRLSISDAVGFSLCLLLPAIVIWFGQSRDRQYKAAFSLALCVAWGTIAVHYWVADRSVLFPLLFAALSASYAYEAARAFARKYRDRSDPSSPERVD
jgi:hypothetical protein